MGQAFSRAKMLVQAALAALATLATAAEPVGLAGTGTGLAQAPHLGLGEVQAEINAQFSALARQGLVPITSAEELRARMFPSEVPPLEAHKTPSARFTCARNASATNTQSYLGMKRRRTRYRTALGASKRFVSDFWVIFPDGPKRQRVRPPLLRCSCTPARADM